MTSEYHSANFGTSGATECKECVQYRILILIVANDPFTCETHYSNRCTLVYLYTGCS